MGSEHLITKELSAVLDYMIRLKDKKNYHMHNGGKEYCKCF